MQKYAFLYIYLNLSSKTRFFSLNQNFQPVLPKNLLFHIIHEDKWKISFTCAKNAFLFIHTQKHSPKKPVFRAREALRQCLPDQLKDATFAGCLRDDRSTQHWLSQLLANLDSLVPPTAASLGGALAP